MVRDLIKYIYYCLRESVYFNCFKRRIYYFSHVSDFKKHEKSIFVIPVPEYGNLGDQAIAAAEIAFAKQYYPEYKIVEISDSGVNSYIELFHKHLNAEDIIFLIGGGNFGTLYPVSEYIRRLIIKKCKKNKIVIFPQSWAYGTSLFDELQVKKSARIYRKHLYLTLLARDQYSFEKMNTYFPFNQIRLAPDVVLSWKCPYVNINRNTKNEKIVLLCMRDDKEKMINNDFIAKIKNILSDMNVTFIEVNTETYKTIMPHKRDSELSSIFSKFSNADYVITDRLHGMIFSCLSGVPCLAFDNTTKKVSGVHKWIKQEQIMLYDSNYQLEEQISKLLSQPKFIYSQENNSSILFDAICSTAGVEYE